MAVGDIPIREGYELVRPNRQKASSKSTKAVIAFMLWVTAALIFLVAIGGWSKLELSGVFLIVFGALYVIFGLLVFGWNRGILPVVQSVSVLLLIFAAVAAPGWFDRDKPGLTSPLFPEELLGLFTVLIIPVSILTIIVALIGFRQEWHVEEERPIDGHPAHDDSRGGYSGGEPEPSTV